MTDDQPDQRETSQPGSEGEGSQDTPPPVPSGDDDSALGDTDQHSSADA